MNIPEIYRNDDTIYHYTSTKTFLNFILPKMELRLSPRRKSNDPIEKSILNPNINKLNIKKEFTKAEIKHSKETALQIQRDIRRQLNLAKQLCFCENITTKFKNNTLKQDPIDNFGFAKPRMWDQYGNKYKGVCLAFSRTELIKTVTENNLRCSKIHYGSYKEIKETNQEINLDRLINIGYIEYLKEYSKHFLDRIFIKHKDYLHENEFRILSTYNGISKFDYIPIKNSLKGVIISDLGSNNHLTKSIKEHLDPNILFHRLNFKHHTIGLSEIR